MFHLFKLSYLFLFISKKVIKNNYSSNTLLKSKKSIIINDDNIFTKYSKNIQNIKNTKNTKKKLYIPKTYNQIEYVKALNNDNIDLLFCTGPAGTGKTLFACSYAIEQLNKNYINKFIITRPTLTIDENIGFLPGDINKKMLPFTQHIYDIFLEYYTQKEINSLIDNKIIEVVPLAFMQGRTFKNSIIIGDEMQNSTPNQMFMLTTRIGTNSKMIITGDPTQTINYKYDYDYENLEHDKIKIIEMDIEDIQRHHIVQIMNDLYQN